MKQNLTVSLLFAFLITAPLVMILFFPKDDFSAEENRMLASLPTASAESLLDGSFSKGLETYTADHFPFRPVLLKLKASMELLAGKKQNGGVDRKSTRLNSSHS